MAEPGTPEAIAEVAAFDEWRRYRREMLDDKAAQETDRIERSTAV